MAKETIIQTVLSNGLQVRLKPHHHQRTINLGLYIGHGSQHEDYESNGIAHYIEHVIFNPNHMPAHVRSLLNDLMDAGVSYEAYTSKEYTRFVVNCRPDLLERALHLLSIIASSKQTSIDVIEHERSIILHEHSMAFSSSNVLKELLDNAMWGDHSVGLFVIGRKENISRFDRNAIEQRLQQNYVADRMTLVALGPIDFASFSDIVERYFGAWETQPSRTLDLPIQTEPRVIALPTNSQRIDLLFAYPGASFLSHDRHAMDLLADALGGGLKSRLFLELRERQQLAYLVHAYTVTYGVGGYIAFKVNCEQKDMERVYQTIGEELEKIKQDGVSEGELGRVKAARTTALFGVLENSGQHLQIMGRRAILGDNFFVDVETRSIDAVSREDIARAAREIFVPENVAIVGLGPKQESLLQLI